MSQTGGQKVESIRDQLVCPQCEYSLRGLGDGVIDCPECGCRCDIAALIAGRWDGPWHQAPALTQLTFTVLLTLLALPGLGTLIGFLAEGLDRHPWRLDILMLGVMLLFPTGLGWLVLLLKMRNERVQMFTVGMVVTAHLVVLGYLIAMLAAPAVTLLLLANEGLWAAPYVIVLGMIAAVVFHHARRGERRLAAVCIRRYLQRRQEPFD